MPTEQPRAIETLRLRLSAVSGATELFDGLVLSAGDYFKQRTHTRRGTDHFVREPGQEFLSDGTCLVRRWTGDTAESGEFVLPADEWNRFRTGLEKTYSQWHEGIEGAIEAATGLRTLRTRFCPALAEQWFTDLLADLRGLKELRHPDQYKDGSAFWMYRSTPLPEEAGAIIGNLKRAWHALADVEPAKPGKRSPREVLVAIGRDPVRIQDLPPDIGPGHLRAVDLAGWIELLQIARVPVRPTEDRKGTIWGDSSIGTWFSPCRSPATAGNLRWETLYWAIAPPAHPSPEVRATDLGLAELDSLEAGDTSDAGGPKSPAQQPAQTGHSVPVIGLIPIGKVLDQAGIPAERRGAAERCLRRARKKPQWVDKLAKPVPNPKKGEARHVYDYVIAAQVLREAGHIPK